jgi:hypothetical protein
MGATLTTSHFDVKEVRPMSRLPIVIGATAFASVIISSLAFALDSGPVAASAALMIIIGVLGLALGGLSGLILVRAPWARWLLAVTVVLALLLASTSGSTLFWVALVLGLLAVIGLSGPWLTLWVRRQPLADRLGAAPVTLIASGVIAPIYVGFAASEGVSGVHWVFVIVVAASAWSYGRGIPFGIWSFRTLVPILGLLAAARTVSPGGFAVAIGALALGAVAWSPKARAVTAVITPPLPAPASRKESGDASR